MIKLKIADQNNGVLSFDLFDILTHIEAEGESYNWAILNIYLTAKNDSNLNVIQLEKEVNSGEKLFTISFRDLLELSSKFLQVIEGTFVAYTTEFAHVITEKSDLEKKYDIVIEAVDSNHWTIYSNKLAILENIKESFNDIEILY